MSSLTSPGLIKATNDALVKIEPEMNVIRLFSYDCSDAVSDWGLTVKVPVVNGGALSAITNFNPDTNDYEHATGTVTYATVTLSCQPKATFEFTGNDILEAPNSPYWTRCAEGAANMVRAGISKAIGGLFNTSDVTLTATVDDLSAMQLQDFIDLRGECTGRIASTVLGLAPDYYNRFLGLLPANVYGSDDPVRNGYINNVYGFKSVV